MTAVDSGTQNTPFRPTKRGLLDALHSHLAWPRWLLPLAAAHALLIYMGDIISVREDFLSVRPAIGLFVGVLLVAPRRRWPAVIGVGYGVGVVSYMLHGRPFLIALGLVTSGIVEVLFGAYLCQRVSRRQCDLTRPEDVATLWATCALTAPAVGASIGWLMLRATASTPPVIADWGAWYAADALGVMLVAPLIIGIGRRPGSFPYIKTPMRNAVEQVVIIAVCIATAFWVFGEEFVPTGTPNKWILALAVVLGAWRLSTAEVGVMAVGVSYAVLTNLSHPSLALGVGAIGQRVTSSQVVLALMFLAAHVMSVSSTNLRREELRSRMERNRVRELSARVADAEYKERRSISEALHNRIAQPLAAARIRLADALTADTPEARREVLDEVSAILQDALSESSELLESVSPSVLYELGIGSALEWLARRYEGAHAVSITSETIDCRNLPESIGLSLFMCAEELVSNAARHSHASRISIRCSQDAEAVILEVDDDGDGFPVPSRPEPDVPRSGLGLLKVREHTERLGGRMRVLSRPGRGTFVRLTIPVHGRSPAHEEIPSRQLGAHFDTPAEQYE